MGTGALSADAGAFPAGLSPERTPPGPGPTRRGSVPGLCPGDVLSAALSSEVKRWLRWGVCGWEGGWQGCRRLPFSSS